jgi:hypothetical protein
MYTCVFLQVAVKACQQLPACLQHCVLVALRQAACLPLAAAPLASSRSIKAAQADSTAGDCLGVPLAVLLVCLQQVATHVQLSADSMSACVGSLLTHECGLEQALLQGSILLLLAAMCSSCGAGLSQEASTALAAAAEASAQHVKQQLQQLEVGGAEAGVCWLQCSDAAEQQQALLRLQAWATAQMSAGKSTAGAEKLNSSRLIMHFGVTQGLACCWSGLFHSFAGLHVDILHVAWLNKAPYVPTVAWRHVVHAHAKRMC